MPLQDLFRPFFVKTHVAPGRQQQVGRRQADKNDEPDEKNRGEKVVAEAEGIRPQLAENTEAARLTHAGALPVCRARQEDRSDVKSAPVGINAALKTNTSAVGIVDRSQTNKT
jgi:hypothetical protein